MKVMITGANGQLGTDLCRVLKNVDLIPLTHAEIEITSMESVEQAVTRYLPDIVINTAAYIRVDDCEAEQDKAFRVNASGARNLAVACQNLGAVLVHISTDYVFGDKSPNRNLPYTEFDPPAPCNVYGSSKLAGENLVRQFCLHHFIIRTSSLFGIAGASGKGGNFVETMLKLAKEKPEIRVVDDQIFSPTYSHDLAEKIDQIIHTRCYGTYHITNSGICSWYQFTREILNLVGINTPIIPITSDQYPQKAKRPNYSVLGNYQLHLLNIDDMRPWQEALQDYLQNKRYIRELKA